LETSLGDYQLSPAYDLINTRIHVKDPELALKDGLFKNDYHTESFEANGFYAFDDFYELGIKIGILEPRVKKILREFTHPQSEVRSLIQRSFLNEETKATYFKLYQERLKALTYSFKGLNIAG
jgi:serine/threonine-protein kinase HipA